MFYILGIALTFFLVVILFTKKNKSNADKLLAVWLSFIGIHLSLFYLLFSEEYIEFPFLLGFEIPMPLLHCPFLFLYTIALTQPNKIKRNQKHYLFHFLPFLLTYFLLIPFFTLSYPEKIKVYQEGGKQYEVLMSLIFVSILLSGISYLFFTYKKIVAHRKTITQQFSTTEKINLNWLIYLIIGSSFIWVLVIFSEDSYIFFAVVVYVFFIGYFGIKQVGIFTNTTNLINPTETNFLPNLATNENTDLIILPKSEEIEKLSTQIELEQNKDDKNDKENVIQIEPTKNEIPKIKYEKSSVSKDELQAIHQKLTQLMNEDKLFKDPELTLMGLAEQLNTHPNILSQVINSIEEKNFYDYINLQRIEEFKKSILLPQNQKFTLLALALECGFNSKTSFNRNFKKVTHLSPSEYIKRVKNNLA